MSGARIRFAPLVSASCLNASPALGWNRIDHFIACHTQGATQETDLLIVDTSGWYWLHMASVSESLKQGRVYEEPRVDLALMA